MFRRLFAPLDSLFALRLNLHICPFGLWLLIVDRPGNDEDDEQYFENMQFEPGVPRFGAGYWPKRRQRTAHGMNSV